MTGHVPVAILPVRENSTTSLIDYVVQIGISGRS
jgi:hypothetical protein